MYQQRIISNPVIPSLNILVLDEQNVNCTSFQVKENSRETEEEELVLDKQNVNFTSFQVEENSREEEEDQERKGGEISGTESSRSADRGSGFYVGQ